MTYFEGWYNGCFVSVEDWYTDDLVYANIREYYKSTAVSRPDREKSFLLRVDKNRIRHYPASIATMLQMMEEVRNENGQLVPITIRLPEIGLALSISKRTEATV